MSVKPQLPYNLMIKMGRELAKGDELPKEAPETFLRFIDDISWLMSGRTVDSFFTLFPPIKRYEDDGTWDYQSTIDFKNELGVTFTDDNFKELLITSCYENEFIHKLGVGFMTAVSELHKRRTGRGIMEEFAIQHGLPVYEMNNYEVKPKLYLVKGGKTS